MKELDEYSSDEECEETEEYVKLNNFGDIKNSENLEYKDKLKKKYDYKPEKAYEEFIKPRPFAEYSLIEQKYNTICKILNGNHPGTGFLCKIKIHKTNLKLLFTNYSILFGNNKMCSKISILNDNNYLDIKITNNRFTCLNKELDYFCIEILPEDNLNNFLQVDREIYTNFMKNYTKESVINQYRYHTLVLIQYKNFSEKYQEDIFYSKGNLDRYNGKKIFYRIPIQFGAKGSPILSLNSSLDVIGMHRKCGNMKKGILNNGIFFNKILIDIKKKLKNKKD